MGLATHCAQPSPPFRGGVGGGAGWAGFAATSHLAATTAICLNHSGFGRLVAEWQQEQKKFFLCAIGKQNTDVLDIERHSRFLSALPAPVPLYFDGVTLKR